MRNRQVAQAFAARRPGRSVNFHTDGQTLWSYGTVIAEWNDPPSQRSCLDGGSIVTLNVRRYSKSTSVHQSMVRLALHLATPSPLVDEYEGPEARMWRSWRDGINGRARP